MRPVQQPATRPTHDGGSDAPAPVRPAGLLALRGIDVKCGGRGLGHRQDSGGSEPGGSVTTAPKWPAINPQDSGDLDTHTNGQDGGRGADHAAKSICSPQGNGSTTAPQSTGRTRPRSRRQVGPRGPPTTGSAALTVAAMTLATMWHGFLKIFSIEWPARRRMFFGRPVMSASRPAGPRWQQSGGRFVPSRQHENLQEPDLLASTAQAASAVCQ